MVMKFDKEEELTLELFAKLIGRRNHYLVIIYEEQYKEFIIEILDPYGDTVVAGLGKTIEDAISDAIKELESDE